jgi:hypothetical protein
MLAANGLLSAQPPAAPMEIKVTVVAILATTALPPKVDPKLEAIAREVQKREPTLTSFTLKQTTCQPVAIGQKESFPLVEDQVAEVTVKHHSPRDGKVGLMVKAPKVGAITYKTACDKFFPILTGYVTKNNERLIVAVMVPPCP